MLWVVRAGELAEPEQRALQEGRIYATWCKLRHDLSTMRSQDELRGVLSESFRDSTNGNLSSFAGQLWPFAHEIEPGDWVVVPSRRTGAFHVGEAVGAYSYDAEADEPYIHSRELSWVATEVPRSHFDIDLRHAFSAFMRVFRAHRNDAEARLHRMARQEGWSATSAEGKPGHDRPPPGYESPRGDAVEPTAKVIRRRLMRAWAEARSAEPE